MTRSGNQGFWFQEHWEQGLVCCNKLQQTTCFLPPFTILPSSIGKPAHLVCRACHRAFRLEEQAFPCRMSAAHVSGRLKGRWYCLINHLNMPGVINVYCILHNIWDSTGETLGIGKEQKVNISECDEMTKTEKVSPYAQRNSQRCPVRLLWGERQWLGHECTATKEYLFSLVLSGFDSVKHSLVSVCGRLKGQKWVKVEEELCVFQMNWLVNSSAVKRNRNSRNQHGEKDLQEFLPQ